MKKFDAAEVRALADVIISGTGSRHFNKFDDLKLSGKMAAEMSPTLFSGSVLVMSGGAQGWDHYLAKMAFRLELPFILVIPSPDYPSYYWRARGSVDGKDHIETWKRMADMAQEVYYVNDSPRGIKPPYKFGHANFDRNDAMVAVGDKFLVWDPSTPGTSHCYSAIRKAGKAYKIMSR